VRIVHVYKDAYPPVHGGIEQHIALLARLQAAAGHEVEVLVGGARGVADVEERDGYRVMRLPELGRAASSPLTLGFGRALRMCRADIAHFHHPNPIAELFVSALPSSTRVVASYHADITRQRVLGAGYRPLLRRFLARADAIVTSSDRLRDTSAALAPHRVRCLVVPYGVEVPPPREMARLPATVLFVGRFREYKGLPVLLDALARVPGVALRLVGDGPLRPGLDERVRQLALGDRVAFLGDLDAEQLDEEYRRAMALVLPSIRRSEAFGIVLVEALHRGTPLITTELGTGTSWVNQHERTGLVVAAQDAGALSQAIQRLCASGEFWSRCAAGASERAEMFTPERMLEGVERAYAEAAR
jgi:rhamnosyl/mannosyltransferase